MSRGGIALKKFEPKKPEKEVISPKLRTGFEEDEENQKKDEG